MKHIKVTMKEIYDAMRPSVEKNKKKYIRKIEKHTQRTTNKRKRKRRWTSIEHSWAHRSCRK